MPFFVPFLDEIHGIILRFMLSGLTIKMAQMAKNKAKSNNIYFCEKH